MNVGGVYTFLGSVSLQQKFEVMDRPSVTAQFYWQAKENTSLRHESMPKQKTQREKKPPGPILAPLFICFFLLPLGLPYVNWASQGCCLFHLRSSLWSCTFLCSIFTGFSLPCLLATAILDSFFLF